jgi:hypothetical protein
MISTKFKPGQRVWYISSLDNKKRYGTVVAKETAMRQKAFMVRPDKPKVFAAWDNDSDDVGYMMEKDVFTDEPKFKRNLPIWW